MIKPSECWRFVEALEDKGYYEEEVVQHLLTEHRAVRRTFSARICQDHDAAREIVEQAHMAARVTPPPLPFVYVMEETEGAITVVMEQVEGRPLDQLVQEKAFAKAKAWAVTASRIADALMMLRDAGACFEKLDLEHLVVTKADTIRIRQRWPVGRPSSSRLERSALLQRMARQPRGGVYVGGPPLEREELEAFALILIRMLHGLSHTVEQFQATVRRAGETLMEKASPAVVIVGILNGIEGQGALTSLRAVRDRLAEFYQEESLRLQNELLRARQEAEAPRAPEPPPPAPAFDPFSFNAPPGPAGASSREAMPKPSTTPLPRPAAAPRGETDHVNPYAAPDVAPPAAKKAAAPITAPLSPDDVAANPYAAVPGSSEVVGSAPAAPPKKSSPLIPLGRPVKNVGGGIAKAVVALVVVAAVVAVGAFGSTLFSSSKPNLKPTAVIAPLPKADFAVSASIPLSAAPSSDPEAQSLSFDWQIVKPESLSGIFNESGSDRPREGRLFSTKVSDISVQFLSAGEVTMQLVVFDGINRSEPVTVSFSVK